MGNKVIKGVLFILFFLPFFYLSTAELMADGFIIPVPRPEEKIPPLTIKYHRVSVEIDDQVARTSVDQVFLNSHDRDIEGIFIFPIPEDAAISEFSMYIGDKKVEGEILDREKALKIYEDIVRRMKDPALLEYMGRNMFRARVYPIPAHGEKRIQLTYTQLLKAENNVVKYTYPLNTERFSLRPIKEVTISLRIHSSLPIANIYSPSHKVSIRKEKEREARVSFEEFNVKPEKDFILYYSLTRGDVGLSFINWEDAETGYYMLLASPPYTSEKEKVMNKDLVFVLDSSGSMSGRKIEQARDAVRFIINHLEKNDRFSVIDFDDGVNVFSQEPVPATAANKEKALEFVKEIEDSGGTNINDALLRALQMIEGGERPDYILFLTDGRPTTGVTDTGEILKNIKRANKFNTRIFVFGVGYDVNTELLDRISLHSRGTSVYVGERDNLEVAVSNYYQKISSPLLAELEVNFKGIDVSHSYPRLLPDLFKGSQLILVGKYRGDGPVTVSLTGKVKKKEKKFVLKTQPLAKDASFSFLPRLWATRRIGYLLEEIRLGGEKEELVEEVKRLGLKYGIVTPYTSFLVTEKEREMVEAAAPEAFQAIKTRRVTGAGAVKAARISLRFKTQERAQEILSERIKYKDDKTFYFKDGYWIDSLYEEGEAVKEIPFNSRDFFNLISRKPGIAKYLSVARNLILCFEGECYRISESQKHQ